MEDIGTKTSDTAQGKRKVVVRCLLRDSADISLCQIIQLPDQVLRFVWKKSSFLLALC